MKNFYDFLIPIILIVSLILLANPYMFWMPTTLHMMVLVVLIVCFVIFGSFIWKEKVADERENLHRFVVGRYAFLAVTSVLLLGIIIQTINHTLDIWLVAGLVTGILTKVIGSLYTQRKL